MANGKQPLQNDQIAEVSGGVWDLGLPQRDYEPYNDKDFPVSCPKCKSHNIWYIPGMFGIEDLDEYWCRDCDNKFDYGEMPFHGASGDW